MFMHNEGEGLDEVRVPIEISLNTTLMVTETDARRLQVLATKAVEYFERLHSGPEGDPPPVKEAAGQVPQSTPVFVDWGARKQALRNAARERALAHPRAGNRFVKRAAINGDAGNL
jgi:hypothetical protein